MRKQLLLIKFLLLTLIAFSQSSGTFTGTFTATNTSDIYSFTSSGNGQYIFTGSYSNTSEGWVQAAAYIGTFNNYNIGGSDSLLNNLNFESDCVENGQVIGLQIDASGVHSYTISYQFVPTTYSSNDTEPNDTFAQAINTTENTNYEGWFNNGSQSNSSDIDDTDWYKFTSPRDGELIITIEDGDEYGGEAAVTVYNSNNLSQPLFPILEQNGLTTTYKYESFNFTGQEFGILLQSNCVSYRMSWEVDNSKLSIENFDLDKSIELFPNPTSDYLNIQNNGNLSLEKLEIIEMTGKIVYQTNRIENQISLRNLDSGIYFVRIYSNKGITTKKVIKSE